MIKKKSLIMWADKNIFKTSLSKIKEGIDGNWTYTGTNLYESPFNPCWNGEPRTDRNSEDVIKIRVIIEKI